MNSFVVDGHAPTALAELGMRERDLPGVARTVAGKSFPNPRPITYAGILSLLTAAFGGRFADVAIIP